MGDLPAKLQAVLFSEGGALTFKTLAKVLVVSEIDVKAGLAELSAALANSGLSLIVSDTEAVLAVSVIAKGTVIARATEEYDRDIGDAGLEVLAIVLYQGPSTRATIDYIRGVNSSSTIRNLLIRGLVERSGNPEDGREFIYRPTTELLAHLGVTDRQSLPDYAALATELATFKSGEPPHAEPSA